MSAPFITFTYGRVKEGRLADFRSLNAAIAERVEEQEPRVIAFHAMLSDDGERVGGIQFHPDAQSLEFHLQVVGDLIRNAGEVLEILQYTVLGPSSEAVDKLMTSMAESGVDVQHLPDHLGGFTRSSAAA